MRSGSGFNAQIAPLTVRLLASTLLILVLAALYGRVLVEWLQPTFSIVLAWAADDFHILSLNLMHEGGDTSLEARAMLARAIVIGGQTIAADQRHGFAVTTTLGTVLQPILTAIIFALAWPGRWAEVPARLAFVVVLLVPVVCMDAPLYLAASLWDMQVRAFEPTRLSPLLWWMAFLTNGGRLALGLVAGAIAVAVARKMSSTSGALYRD